MLHLNLHIYYRERSFELIFMHFKISVVVFKSHIWIFSMSWSYSKLRIHWNIVLVLLLAEAVGCCVFWMFSICSCSRSCFPHTPLLVPFLNLQSRVNGLIYSVWIYLRIFSFISSASLSGSCLHFPSWHPTHPSKIIFVSHPTVHIYVCVCVSVRDCWCDRSASNCTLITDSHV